MDENIKGSKRIVEIKLSDGTRELNNNITLTIPYSNSDIPGLNEANLRLFYLDETNNNWTLIEDSEVDVTNNKVTARVNHLTIFRIMEYVLINTAIENLTNYPNPFRAGIENTNIKYALKESKKVELKIYDLIGGLVLERSISAGETGAKAGINIITWDGKNGSGHRVDVGSYILSITCNGKNLRRKIAIK